MGIRGRPPVKQAQLKNGFYIEVCNKNTKKGVKIRCSTRQAMEEAAKSYSSYKDVIILGEYKDGVKLVEPPLS